MSTINRSLLASAAASVMSTTSTTSTASTASVTSKKGALSSPEGVSLDAYVRRAWSSLNSDVVSVAPEAFAFGYRADKNTDTEASGEAIAAFFADVDVDDVADADANVEVSMNDGIKTDSEVVTGLALESDRKENIYTGSDVDKVALPNATAALFERYVPKAPELEFPAVDAKRPFKHKEPSAAATDRAEEGVEILPLPPMPLQALIPPCPENIKMSLQVGKGFSTAPSIGASAMPQTDTPVRTPRAGLAAIPQFSNGIKPISKKLPPVETVSAAMSVRIPKSGKIDAKPTSLGTGAIYGDVALSADAPQKPTQKPTQTPAEKPTQTSTRTETQTKVSAPIPTPTTTQTQRPIQTSMQMPVPTPLPTSTPTQQLAAHSADMPRKEKSLPGIAPDALVPPLPLIQAMQEQTVAGTHNLAAAPQDSARHSPQPGQQPAAAPVASTDAAAPATTGNTLTYRFDKWNGNHAVTVHAPLHADGRSREVVPTGRNTEPQTVQNAEKVAVQNTVQANLQNNPQFNAQYSTQYSLSPSDDLVSQRLSEYLARTAGAQDTPSMRLTDSDERQRRQGQGQAQQEDDEDET